MTVSTLDHVLAIIILVIIVIIVLLILAAVYSLANGNRKTIENGNYNNGALVGFIMIVTIVIISYIVGFNFAADNCSTYTRHYNPGYIQGNNRNARGQYGTR